MKNGRQINEIVGDFSWFLKIFFFFSAVIWLDFARPIMAGNFIVSRLNFLFFIAERICGWEFMVHQMAVICQSVTTWF